MLLGVSAFAVGLVLRANCLLPVPPASRSWAPLCTGGSEEPSAASDGAARGFFSMYGEEELAALWDVHSAHFVSENDPDEHDSGGGGGSGLAGGLHEAVLRTLAEDGEGASASDERADET